MSNSWTDYSMNLYASPLTTPAVDKFFQFFETSEKVEDDIWSTIKPLELPDDFCFDMSNMELQSPPTSHPDVMPDGPQSSSIGSDLESDTKLMSISEEEEDLDEAHAQEATNELSHMFNQPPTKEDVYIQPTCLVLDGEKLVAKDRIFDMHVYAPSMGNRTFVTDPKPERWSSTDDDDDDGKQLVFFIRMKDSDTGEHLHPKVMASVKRPMHTKSIHFKNGKAILNVVIRNATVTEWPPVRKHQRRKFTFICWMEERDLISGKSTPVTKKTESDVIQFAGNRRIASKATTLPLIPWNKFISLSGVSNTAQPRSGEYTHSRVHSAINFHEAVRQQQLQIQPNDPPKEEILHNATPKRRRSTSAFTPAENVEAAKAARADWRSSVDNMPEAELLPPKKARTENATMETYDQVTPDLLSFPFMSEFYPTNQPIELGPFMLNL